MTFWSDYPLTGHLSEVEKRCASLWFKVDPATVVGPPTGLVIGEMPGRSTSSKLPLFPYPANSSGGRLLKMSGMSVGTYLGRLERVNLIKDYATTWDHDKAVGNAIDLINSTKHTRIIILGDRVGQAFGFVKFFSVHEYKGMIFNCIPHPSGLNRTYNNPIARAGAKAALEWAADVLEVPKEK